MSFEKNSRQVPKNKNVVKNKDYCDILYAWLQCNSERIGRDTSQRFIEKNKINFTKIEKDFTNKDTNEKIMNRKTIAKYFNWLLNNDYIEFDEQNDRYLLRVLDKEEASLIEYNTLSALINVFKRNSVNIYILLYARYCANGFNEYIITIRQIKEFIGIATSTTSNNNIVSDTLDILKRLGLLDYKIVQEEEKSVIYITKVVNRLPDRF